MQSPQSTQRTSTATSKPIVSIKTNSKLKPAHSIPDLLSVTPLTRAPTAYDGSSEGGCTDLGELVRFNASARECPSPAEQEAKRQMLQESACKPAHSNLSSVNPLTRAPPAYDGNGEECCEECVFPDPPEVSSRVRAPPESDATGGDGGCTASALFNIGVFATYEDAVVSLDAQIPPLSAKFTRERGYEKHAAGVPGIQWHAEAIASAVKAAGWHFRSVPIDPKQNNRVDLRATLKSDSYIVIGVTNNQWYKGQKKQKKHADYSVTAPATVPNEWVHTIGVIDGKIRDWGKTEPLSYLWLANNNQPNPKKGYMRTIRKVYRVYKCANPGGCCKGECKSLGHAAVKRRLVFDEPSLKRVHE